MRSSSYGRSSGGYFEGVDFLSILVYIAIAVIGCVCITSATFDDASTDFFASSHLYVRQYIWLGVSLLAALIVLLVDASVFHKYAYVLYLFGVVLLVATLLFGREVNGAKSWFSLGPMRFQPVELAKITTSLAVARVMSEYSFSVQDIKGLAKMAAVVLLPLAIIVLQNDTGSGIVFGSFLFVLYREGLNKWLCIPMLLIALLFVVSFVLSPLVLLLLSIFVCVVCDAMMCGEYKQHIQYVAVLAAGTLLGVVATWLLFNESASVYAILMCVTLLTMPFVLFNALRQQLSQTFVIVGFFLFTMIFLPVSDYIFNTILRPHQQNRIMSFLGMISDPLGSDYNVNQSKIAIGSGGFWGKGFLDGTQIKYGFVPEKHTDFIFCDLAEEWGFVGVAVLLMLLATLILRLMSMGERQVEGFGRVYCYCVASILLFHIFVNVGMTIGLMPVMGIPLPFMSYGGSSLLAFTVMIFIAFRLDASASRIGGYN
ncbi:MAG: rod shape-determining protein RodA [Rikenellaceae bacterium]